MLLKQRELYNFGSYRLDLSSRTLTRSGEAINLAPKTFDLLALLVKGGGRLWSKAELMASLWPDMFVEEANLSFQISTLRKALGQDGAEWIETVPKHGYRFRAEVTIPEQDRELPEQSQPLAHNQVPLWKRRWFLATAIGTAVAIAFVAVAVKRVSVRSSREPNESSPAVPLTAYPGYQIQPSLSPDGSQVAFAWNGANEDNFDIYVKLVGPGQPLRLTRDAGWDDNPAWSPDGRLIAFLRFRSPVSADVLVIPALGGAERKLTTISLRREGSTALSKRLASAGNLAWTPDGKWIAFGGRPADDQPLGIWMIAVDGTERRRLTQPGLHDFGDWTPAFSPDATSLAFIRERSLSTSAVYLLPLSPALTPAGPPQPVTHARAAIQGLSWMPTGHSLLFSSGGHHGLSQMWRITVPGASSDRAGRPEPLSFGEHAGSISTSKNGHVVYSAQFRDSNIWKLALGEKDQPAATPLVRSIFDEETPDYSPDGKRLVFTSTRSGAIEIWISDADGSNPVQVTSMRGPQCGNATWSPDGRRILFNSRREGSADLYLLWPDTGEVRRITDDPAEEAEPRWSRDGRSIYFGSNRSGTLEVWNMPAAGGPAVRITKHGGLMASESPDGRFLYYAKHEGSPSSIWRVPVGGGEEKLIVDGLSYSLNFVVAERGLYFLALGDKSTQTSIDFFEFATGNRTTLLKLGKEHWYGMALSPDRKSLLYSVVDNAGSNLMLVDNFR